MEPQKPTQFFSGMNPEELKKIILKYEFWGILFVVFFSALLLFSIPSSTTNFPQYFDVPKGSGLSQISNNLYEMGFIRSELQFKMCAYLLGGHSHSVAGVYEFEKALGPCVLAKRISSGVFSISPVKITIPEGFLKSEIALKFKDYPRFNKEIFLNIAPDGYLFPDTYFFNPNMTEKEVIEKMTNNFNNHISPLEPQIVKSKRTLKEVIIVASIVERETIFPEDRPKVAQVLWKRLDLGMPLQADATFAYINGKGTFQLTDDDLKINSPYNTYNHVGLPPTPIGNPGLDAIKATITPSKTNYLYFLSDKAGHMYFAKTFEEHQTNREKYLGK
ncbi:MAG: endolytic transglycosylase MltG [Minisyncoccia bacterium]